jgi:type II secretory pathway predicted ATPase ExeA
VFEQHFGFTQPPFRKDLPPPSLYRSQGHVELTTRLRLAAERCHIAIVTGGAGAGKSTALRAVAQTLGLGGYRFLYTALIVDEADLLAPAMLEELRMLTNFEMDAAPVFARSWRAIPSWRTSCPRPAARRSLSVSVYATTWAA